MPYRCKQCRRQVQDQMHNRVRAMHSTTRNEFEAMVATLTGLDGPPLREMCAQALMSPYLVCAGDTVASAIYHAEQLLRAATDAVVLRDWLPANRLPLALEAVITSRSERRPGIFTFKAGGRWMARASTPLDAVDAPSLFAALERRGLRGTQLSTIYAEYDNAHLDVHLPTAPVVTAHGMAWHRSVAAGPDQWAVDRWRA